ncbi:hypothetical protein [Enterococcus sp. HY326]|uniref:hypothetical protein n=1 Tax=Enterococcus sp. HY326 TaxID=2971265 RepID=UPI00223EA1B0|nr:hypothetical protein [Enterococcus sp. HY326]
MNLGLLNILVIGISFLVPFCISIYYLNKKRIKYRWLLSFVIALIAGSAIAYGIAEFLL